MFKMLLSRGSTLLSSEEEKRIGLYVVIVTW